MKPQQARHTKTRAALYLRVSTDEQAKEGYGLVYQEEKLKAFVQSQDYELTDDRIYKDEGYSGSLPITDRPSLQRLFHDVDEKKFDVVLVYRLDRFFRKTRLLLDAMDQLNSHNVGFRSITESFDTTNITGRFMTTLLGAVAEMERDTIKERTTNGKAASARDGNWVSGNPPYGYRLNKKTKRLVVEPKEAAIVKKMFRWIVYEKVSLREIQKRMIAAGVPTPWYGKTKNEGPMRWHKRSIGRILTNETYCGISYYRKYKRPFNNLTSIIDPKMLRDQSDWIPIKVPALISTTLFEDSKKQLQKNREFSERNTKRMYLFAKLVYCGYCGFKMFGGYQPSTKKGCEGSRYYHGALISKEDRGGTTKRCQRCGQIAESRLLPVWDAIKELLENPNTVLEQLAKSVAEHDDKKKMAEELEDINKQINSSRLKRQKIGQIYAEDDGMAFEAYHKTISELRANEDSLQKKKLRIEQAMITLGDVREKSAIIGELYEKLKTNLEGATYEQKHLILRRLVTRISVFIKTDEAEVEIELPNAEKETGIPSPISQEMSLLRDSPA